MVLNEVNAVTGGYLCVWGSTWRNQGRAAQECCCVWEIEAVMPQTCQIHALALLKSDALSAAVMRCCTVAHCSHEVQECKE